ncbi:MAG: glycosyltransferase [Clostridia bacterium]|nr:glycosyltransferase [Clostridia bacterium]
MKLKVSIIIGLFNEEKNIDRCMESVMSQTLSDFECILCDDGSKDMTYKKAKNWEARDSRIKVLQNLKNSGLAATLNHCLAVASGEYVARMDADDIAAPERLAAQVEFLDKHLEYAFCGSNVRLFDHTGIWGEKAFAERPEKKELLWCSPFRHPTLMIRKSALDEVGGYRVAWDTTRTEDYDLFFRLYAKGFKGYNLQQSLLDYYEGRESYQKRKFRYRVQEASIRFKGYRLNHMLLRGFPLILKPVLVGLIPPFILKRMRRNKYGSSSIITLG